MSKPPVYYPKYLQLEKILGAQAPESAKRGAPAHDEMLFIIIHQTYELWFKQILWEVSSVKKMLSASPLPSENLSKMIHQLKRVIQIQHILVEQLNVMETMTSLDFLDFRDDLIPASGFQSLQFRLLEANLGVDSSHRLAIEKQFFQSRLSPEHLQELMNAEKETSLLVLVEKWLERMPFAQSLSWDFWSLYSLKVQEMVARDRASIEKNPHLSEKAREMEIKNLQHVELTFHSLLDSRLYEKAQTEGAFRISQKAMMNAVFISLYPHLPALHMPHQFLRTLVEVDEFLTLWRYRHAIMAHRLLGSKIGTGGSAGSDYLRRTTEKHRIFTDFFNLSTFLIPQAHIPALPEDLKEDMGLNYEL